MKNQILSNIEEWTGHGPARRSMRSDLLKALGILCLLLAAFLLMSCTSGPVVTSDKVWMGGSALTKNKGHYARYAGPLGTIEVGTTENDETIIPGKIVNYYGIAAGINGANSALRTRESTTRVLAREETSRLGIKTAGANEALRIKNPLPEPLPVPVPSTGFDPGTGLNLAR